MKKEISSLIAASIVFSGAQALAENISAQEQPLFNNSEIRINLPTESNYSQEVTPGSHVYILHDPDQKDVLIDLSKAIGFTPDKNLIISPLKPKQLGLESAEITRDFQKYLNTKRDGYGPLAGYTDGTNDYNQYKDNQSSPQIPAGSWSVFTGESVDFPGIGKIEGGTGLAVALYILNITDNVFRPPTNSVTVKSGFHGFGRIWDGSEKSLLETEKRLANHYATRMGEGVPESGFFGQTNQGKRNADYLTNVSVKITQWGYNQNGTPRYQIQLLRAETVPAIKK